MLSRNLCLAMESDTDSKVRCAPIKGGTGLYKYLEQGLAIWSWGVREGFLTFKLKLNLFRKSARLTFPQVHATLNQWLVYSKTAFHVAPCPFLCSTPFTFPFPKHRSTLWLQKSCSNISCCCITNQKLCVL